MVDYPLDQIVDYGTPVELACTIRSTFGILIYLLKLGRILIEHIYIICRVLTKQQIIKLCSIGILHSSRVI